MMKFTGLVFCILGFNLTVRGAEFRFGEESKDPCILLNLDATFNLTLEENGGIRTAAPFNLEGAMVAPNKSICGTDKEAAVLTVQIFPSNERLTFRFIQSNGNVEMSVVLDMVPEKHFDNQNTTMQLEVDSDDDLYIGALSKSSFKCLSEQMMVFNRDEPFNMTMAITNLHVQAYTIEGDNFGPVVECTQDMVTTPGQPTTEPIPISTPVTTQPVTVPVYILRQNNIACIVLKARLELNIKYMRKDEQQEEVNVYVPENAQVDGSCGIDNTATVQTITLTFFDTKWKLEIDIKRDGEKAVAKTEEGEFGFHWERVRLTFDVDNHFEDAADAGLVKTVETEYMDHEFTAPHDGSYKCNSKQSMVLSSDVTMATSDLQYKAFSETDDIEFSGEDVMECNEDDKTSSRRTLFTVLGSVFGGLAVLIFTIGFIWKVRSRKRVNYELLAGVSYDRSVLRSDTSMDKRVY